LIGFTPGAGIGYFIAQHMKIPSILGTPFPMTPTKEYPALIFYNFRFGKVFNLLTHKIFEEGFWLALRSPVQKFWGKEFGKKPDEFSCPFSQQKTAKLPTIISCSNYVFPRPADWSEHIHCDGYWFLEEQEEFRASSDLLNFLKSGKPPVYVGFGSIGDKDQAARTTEIVMAALKQSGQRGILATGWSGMSKPDHIPEDIFILESAPHSWLFPQMAAVVHHFKSIHCRVNPSSRC